MKKKNDKRKIYILGPLKAQNELLASFLEREKGIQCLAFDNSNDIIIGGNGEKRQPTLTLWDCFAKDCEACLKLLESECKRLLAKDYVAFFNVTPRFGIEKEAVVQGVKGFFYSSDPADTLLKGISTIFKGDLWAPRKIISECLAKVQRSRTPAVTNPDSLTLRETEILEMVAAGYSTPQIADKLYISFHTVKTHLYNTYRKINVPSRIQAARWAKKYLNESNRII
jgi:LuxR family transcriptional regulator of csgAB operon